MFILADTVQNEFMATQQVIDEFTSLKDGLLHYGLVAFINKMFSYFVDFIF